jgi:hypothetical protein
MMGARTVFTARSATIPDLEPQQMERQRNPELSTAFPQHFQRKTRLEDKQRL